MAEIIKGAYKRRHPEQTDYYRVIESSLDEFERKYSKEFSENFGYLRTEVLKAIYSFLDCGIPENGMARVRCRKCGNNYFVSFSCRQRVVCPSCSTKRCLLFSEKVAEIVRPVSHIHITFTIPKILRGLFKRNRKLLKLLVKSANYALNRYYKSAIKIDGLIGGIYYIQSQGNLFNYHPHVHGLVTCGVMKDGVFYEQTNISTVIIGEIFRRKLLKLLQKQKIIPREFVDNLLKWNHNSGFNVHAGAYINGEDIQSIEKVAKYMSRAPISVNRVKYNVEDNTVVVYEKQDESIMRESRAYSILEFMAHLSSHIPSAYESLVYYYGIYSSSHRGKKKRENAENEEVEIVEITGKKGITNGRMTSSWARLIKHIFEVDPLICRKCGGDMNMVAFITNRTEIKNILEYAHEETKRPPPLKLVFPKEDDNSEFRDYQPSVDDGERFSEYA